MPDTAERTKVTPPELAARWGVNPDKVLFFIRSGELKAFDASLLPGQGRPRYLIDEADIEAFENSPRRLAQAPLPRPTRRKPVGIVRNFRGAK